MAAAKTSFIPVTGSPDGVRRMLDNCSRPLVIVSRHGLGDNVFFSPCFEPLRNIFGQLFFCSCVNAYASIFHDSPLVKVLYAGGVNGQSLGLEAAEGFASQFERFGLDLGVAEAWVYHFGLFEPHLPYEDERAFVKGRRNLVELFGTGPLAFETPRYHVAPTDASRTYVRAVLDQWLPGRDLIAIARYGHTDGGKNFGDDSRDTVRTAQRIDERWPGRFKYLSFDYSPGENAAEGRLSNIRSVYGFLPCDSGCMCRILECAKLLITVPTGPMLVGAAIRSLRMLTLWRTMSPYHFLDPQFGGDSPVHAIVERPDLASTAFMSSWGAPSREAVQRRWKIRVDAVTPEVVADSAIGILESL